MSAHAECDRPYGAYPARSHGATVPGEGVASHFHPSAPRFGVRSGMTNDPGRVCVVGGGIIGASAALHLVEAGASDVVLVDAGDPLSGTTPAGAGFVARFGSDHNRRLGGQTVALQDYGLRFYRRLHDEGADLEFAANGNVVLALTDGMLDTLAAGILDHPAVSADTRRVERDETVELLRGTVDPNAIAGGVFMPEGIQLTTGLALEEMLRRLDAANVDIRWNTPVTGIRLDNGIATGVETPDGIIEASTVVLAAGAWNNVLLDIVDRPLPLIPMVATRCVSEPAGLPSDMPTVQCMELGLWLRELHGAFSWGGGFAYRLLSALREDGLEFELGRPVVDELVHAQHAHQAAVADVFPALSGLATAETIQGIPVYTVDGGLYIGSVPDVGGLWAVAGDSESGITHGPGMGRLVAELVTGTTPFTDPTPFRLDRVDMARYPDEASMVAAMAEDRIATTAQRG